MRIRHACLASRAKLNCGVSESSCPLMNTQSVPRCLTDTFPLDPVSTPPEGVHHVFQLFTEVTGSKNTPTLKIDMSKAYDKVEWPFLRNMMLKLGFQVSWVDLVMKCVTIMHYCTSHKGQDLGPILPERGLLHGGPIPPYMFILCVEGLSCLLQNRERRGLIHGCQVARGTPTISLFFCRSKLPIDKLEHLVMLCWAIWGRRNFVVWSAKGGSAAHVCTIASHSLVQWQEAQSSPFPLAPDSDCSPSGGWRPPPPGFIKCNVDAAFTLWDDNGAVKAKVHVGPSRRLTLS